MKINFKKLAVCIIAPLAVGALSALISRSGMENYGMMTKPPLAPPAWVFPVVWTVLYILMGVSSYLISESGKSTEKAMIPYVAQLAVNFLWSPIFFLLENYVFAFIWLIALIVLVVWTAVSFYGIDKTSGLLFIPYIVWLAIAAYLNFGVFLLNR